MPRYVAKVFHEQGGPDSMRGLPGPCGDFQHLAEGAECLAGDLGGVIRASIGDHHDPERIVPARMAVGRKQAVDALADRGCRVASRYDNPYGFDLRTRSGSGERVACWSRASRHGSKNRKSTVKLLQMMRGL